MADMDEKTARKYSAAALCPSQLAQPHAWRTRPDTFDEVWPLVQEQLQTNPGLAYTYQKLDSSLLPFYRPRTEV